MWLQRHLVRDRGRGGAFWHSSSLRLHRAIRGPVRAAGTPVAAIKLRQHRATKVEQVARRGLFILEAHAQGDTAILGQTGHLAHLHVF